MNPLPYERYRPFANVFVPFAVLLAVANLIAEAQQVPIPSLLDHNPKLSERLAGNLTFARVVYSIWLAMVFSLPALVLFFLHNLGTAPAKVYRYWQLFWTFGFLAYLLHAYLAVGVWFEWDFAQISRRQSPPVAWSNYLLLLVWGIDVLVSVLVGQRASQGGFRYFQWLTHLFFAGATLVAAVVFFSIVKTQIGLGLGILVVGSAVLALLVRLIWR